jgi:hypothetical protein
MPCYLLPANLLILPNPLTIEVGFNSQLDSIILQRAPFLFLVPQLTQDGLNFSQVFSLLG